MHFLKRSLVNITRKPAKSFVLLILVFLIGNLVSGAIFITNAVTTTEANLWATMPAFVTIEGNMDFFEEYYLRNGNWPIIEDAPELGLFQEIADLPYVTNYILSLEILNLYSTQLQRYEQLNITQSDLPEEVELEWIEEDGSSLRWFGIENLEHFTMSGVQDSFFLDIQSGLIDLVDGRLFTRDEIESGRNVALISRGLAEANDLQVGSIITLESRFWDTTDWGGIPEGWIPSDELYRFMSDESLFDRKVYELEIVGLFDSNTGHLDYYLDPFFSAQEEREINNRIYVPNAVSEIAFNFRRETNFSMGFWDDITSFDEFMVSFRSIFILGNPRYMSDFRDAVSEILPPYLGVSDLSSIFSHMTSSMNQMLWIADIILYVSIIAMVLIISLTVILFLRDRKQEIGIYCALGEKKYKVASQILIEVLTVSMLAISLSVFSGNLISGSLSTQMIEAELINQQESSWSGPDVSWNLRHFSPGFMSVEEMMSAYDVALDSSTVLAFYSIALLTLSVSVIAPIIYVLKLNPKKILM